MNANATLKIGDPVYVNLLGGAVPGEIIAESSTWWFIKILQDGTLSHEKAGKTVVSHKNLQWVAPRKVELTCKTIIEPQTKVKCQHCHTKSGIIHMTFSFLMGIWIGFLLGRASKA